MKKILLYLVLTLVVLIGGAAALARPMRTG